MKDPGIWEGLWTPYPRESIGPLVVRLNGVTHPGGDSEGLG